MDVMYPPNTLGILRVLCSILIIQGLKIIYTQLLVIILWLKNLAVLACSLEEDSP